VVPLMASKILHDAVTGSDEAGWDFVCPVDEDPQQCGDQETGEKFKSTGWPTRKTAEARGQIHFDEHTGEGKPVSLEDFRKEHGLVVSDDGKRATVTVDMLRGKKGTSK